MKIEITPIGYAETEFKKLTDMPIQPKGGMDKIGKIIIKEKFKEGLKDLDGFNFIYLIYYFHKNKKFNLPLSLLMIKLTLHEEYFLQEPLFIQIF